MANEQQMVEVWRMRVNLDPAAVGEPVWPDAVCARRFTLDDAEALHALLEHGYRRGSGTVTSFETWLPQMITDEEFDAELWFLAESHARLVGAVLCWTSAFVKDVVVHESWRRRGLGEALLRQAFQTFAARGADAVELKVEATNTSAVRLYERLGMRVVERLDRGPRARQQW
ncbi:MAG: N-acetyltransferase family protein [Solirubrobacteraceae bacterium]